MPWIGGQGIEMNIGSEGIIFLFWGNKMDVIPLISS